MKLADVAGLMQIVIAVTTFSLIPQGQLYAMIFFLSGTLTNIVCFQLCNRREKKETRCSGCPSIRFLKDYEIQYVGLQSLYCDDLYSVWIAICFARGFYVFDFFPDPR